MKKTHAAVAMLILVGILIAGRATGGPAPEDPAAAQPAPTAAGAPPATPLATPSMPSPPAELRVSATGEPDTYAAAVADVVFGMDTRTLGPDAYRATLLGEADPHLSVTGLADLERLLAERIPTGEQWARMRANAQWSAFEAGEVWEPGSWAQVVIAGQAEPGWVVRNVTGVQTTHYTDAGVEKTAVRERTVTFAMRCPAPGAGVEACRLVLIGGSVLP